MDKKLNYLLKLTLFLISLSLIFNIYEDLISSVKILFNLILPFLIGFTIAFLLNPMVDKLEKKRCNRKAISIIFIGSFVLLTIIIIFYIGPIIIKEGNNLLDNFPTYVNNIKKIIENITTKIFKNNSITFDYETEIKNKIIPVILKYLTNILQTTFSYVILIGIGIVLSLYFLIDYHKIINRLKAFLINKKKEKTVIFLKELEKVMYAYFKGIIFVMIILSVLSAISFMLIGIDLSIIWGLIIGITNVIPYVGPYIGGLIVGIFTLGSAPKKLGYVILVIVVLQVIESNFITPKVESKTVKTHPILVILFMTIFSELLGIIGLLLAVPVLSTLQLALKWQKTN